MVGVTYRRRASHAEALEKELMRAKDREQYYQLRIADLEERLNSPANTVTDNSAVIERLERENDELRASCERLLRAGAIT